MNTKIILIDNYDSFTYNLIQIVESQGFGVKIIKNDEIDITEINKYENILISPGPGIPAEAGKLIPVIKKFAPTKRILGICLGHQAIAEAFGGKLIRMPRVSHGMKRELKVLRRDEYLFNGLPAKFEAGLYHSWMVSKKYLPECFEITATDHDGIIMSIAHKEFDVRGIQFHPESIMTTEGKKILSNWLNH
ncbi:MAG: aminodeoxychorismate/anthranilate synthase component II [Ignavibacteriales bacterium]|nr:aminodeoxychorismate/anthranilate synthase component II [Ignavibacteriales bacterium]